MALTVAVIGYASADHSVLVDAFPAADATAVVRRRISRPWPRLGGCAPQIAASLAAGGVPAACLTWLAPDDVGTAMLGQLRASGADTRGVVVGGTRTAESFIAYDAGGRSACFYDPGDAGRGALTPAQRELLAAADVVCLTVGPATATRDALDVARDDARVVWSVKADPDAYPPDLVERLLGRADVVALAAGEQAFLERRAPAATPRADAIRIETRGAGGVSWSRGPQSGHVAVQRLDVLDTTGAGDALVAGAIAQLVRDPDDVTSAVAAGVRRSRELLERRARQD